VPQNTPLWISIVNDTSGQGNDWGWVTQFPTTQPFALARRSSDGGVTWPEAFNETLTFSLFDAPEPSSVLLLGLSALPILWRRR